MAKRACRRRVDGPPPARERGVVLVIVLLGLVLLAGLLFYVINLGRQTQQRAETQHAADAAAAAGAGWMARSMNTVAMNNVGITRHLALVNVLDAMPQAVEFTLTDQQAVFDATEAQLGRGVRDDWVRDALNDFRDDLQDELDELVPMDELFNRSGFDITRMTWYHAPQGRGELWRAMLAMDETSQTLMEELGPLAQLNAMRGGEANLTTPGGDDADDDTAVSVMLVPVMPELPWQRGAFHDFHDPLMLGRLPEALDDPVTHRGPFDVLFGWRYPVGGETEGYRIPRSGPSSGGGPNVPFGRGPSQGGNFVTTSRRPDAYEVYGYQGHMLRQLNGHTHSQLPHSRFANRYVRQLVDAKSEFLWGGTGTRQIVAPEWITRFNQAVVQAAADEAAVRETAFVAVEIKSRYSRTDPRFMTPGSWAYVETGHSGRPHSPRVIWAGGWVDPRQWPVPQIASYIWRDEWSYQTTFDHDLGLSHQDDSNGDPIVHTLHRIDDYMFVGINIGEPVDIPNPHNFSDADPLPAPIDLDHDRVGHDATDRHHHLQVLAVAWRDNPALFMEGPFDRRRLDAGNLALAQAGLFNDHSWDLWTQMWHHQLERVDDYQNWVDDLHATAGDADALPWLDRDAVDEMQRRLDALTPLAPTMLTH